MLLHEVRVVIVGNSIDAFILTFVVWSVILKLKLLFKKKMSYWLTSRDAVIVKFWLS